MTSTNSFAQNPAEYELRERALTVQLFDNLPWIKSYSFTSGPVFYDGIAVSQDDRKAIFEIKVRSFGINAYPDYFLEVAKFKNLYAGAERTGHKLLYINYFITEEPDRWEYIVFNLSRRIEEWKVKGSPVIEKVRMNAKTFVSKTEKIYKEIIRLEYEPDKDRKGWVYYNPN